MGASTHPRPRPGGGEHLMDDRLATRNALVVKTMNEPTACRSACVPPRRSVATSGHAWTNLSLRPQALRHLSQVGTKQSRAGLTATRRHGAGRSVTCGARFRVRQTSAYGWRPFARTYGLKVRPVPAAYQPVSRTYPRPFKIRDPRKEVDLQIGVSPQRWAILNFGGRTGLTTTETRARRRLTPSTAVSALRLVRSELTATCCRLLACSGGLNRPDQAEVSGASPLRPTHLTRSFVPSAIASQRTGSLGTFGLSPEELVHHRCSGLNHRLQLMPVDEFGHSRSAVTNKPRDLLDRHRCIRQHRHE
jgi:hypothetical protein